jgi:hypothetical protein
MNVQPGDAILMTAIVVCSFAFIIGLPVLGVAVIRGSIGRGLRRAGWMLALTAVTMAAAACLGASVGHYVFVA